MAPKEFVYDRDYWSQPRKRGFRARAQEVWKLTVVNNDGKKGGGGVRATLEYYRVDKNRRHLDNERYPLSFVFRNDSFLYTRVSHKKAATFRKSNAWYDDETGEQTADNELFDIFFRWAKAPKRAYLVYDEEKGDLAILSSDGLWARVRGSRLQGLSDYFDDRLCVLSDASLASPLSVNETGEDLGLFLRYAFGCQSSQSTLTLAEVKRLLLLTEVYQARLVTEAVCSRQLSQHVVAEPLTIFSLAAIYGDTFIARSALTQFGSSMTIRDSPGSGEWSIEGRLRSVVEVTLELFARIPHAVLQQVFQLQERSLFSTNAVGIGPPVAWPMLASDFSLE